MEHIALKNELCTIFMSLLLNFFCKSNKKYWYCNFFLYFCGKKNKIMTILYLIRHGETVDNSNKIMQGQTQGELNEKGINQARMVSKNLTEEHFDAIISSDLKRSYDTATIIAEPHFLTVVTTPLLRERDWRGFTGRYIPDLKDEPWPDDIESLDALKSRALEFLNFIRTTFPNQKVLAVGHGIINKAIQAVYYGKPMNEILKMDNAEVRLLHI